MKMWNSIVYYVRLFFHPDTPRYIKAILVAAGIYLISPVDLIPDWIGGLGIVDDIAVVPLLVSVALGLLKKNEKNRSSH